MDYFGVDPGTTGCMARLFNSNCLELFRFYKTVYVNGKPKTVMKSHDDLRTRIYERYVPGEHVLGHELVNAFKSDNPYTAGKFMRVTGLVEGYLECAGYEIEYVTSSAWQLEFGLGGLESRAERLRSGQKVIQSLFDMKVTQDEVAAVLIAAYVKRKHLGVLTHGQDKDRNLRPATGIIKRSSVLD